MSRMAGDIKFLLWLLLVSSSSSCFGSDLDIQCLKTILESVVDPNGILISSWDFSNETSGHICQFIGVECLQADENRVLSLRLSNLGLQGSFPQGLEYCAGMAGLDLSRNNFSGPIPSDIALQLYGLSYLDLSYNSFSGEIPILDAYLNTLNLEHNQLSGQLAGQFSQLHQLQSFSVAYNQLSGAIPSALQGFPASNFTGNQGLCGPPLDYYCAAVRSRRRLINDESIIGAAVGFVVGFEVAFYFPHLFVFSKRLHPYVFRIC